MNKKYDNILIYLGAIIIFILPLFLGYFNVLKINTLNWYSLTIGGSIILGIIVGITYTLIKDGPSIFKEKVIKFRLNKYRVTNMKEHGAISSFICKNLYDEIENNIEKEKDKGRIHHLISELALEFMNDCKDGYGKKITDWESYRRYAYVEETIEEDIIKYVKHYIFRRKAFGI